jgi:hypothetical protein
VANRVNDRTRYPLKFQYDETSIKLKQQWYDLYRAVDSDRLNRTPAAPPSASPRARRRAVRRTVRRAQGVMPPGSRSVKMRREHAGLRQNSRLTWSRQMIP